MMTDMQYVPHFLPSKWPAPLPLLVCLIHSLKAQLS